MRQITIGFSLLALFCSVVEPAYAGAREGVPGRRVGGGSRWTQPQLKPSSTAAGKLSALAFASRANVPMALRLKALYS